MIPAVTSLDPKLARTMEPRASTPPKRLEAIKMLAEAGIPTTVMVAPVIPALNDSEIERILDEGQKSGDFALPADLTITADLVQCAMMKFRIPQLWTTEALEALRAELEGVLGLIFTGLSARR